MGGPGAEQLGPTGGAARTIVIAGVLLALLLLAAWGAAVLRSRGGPARPAEARFLPSNRESAVTYVALGDSTVVGVGASRPERGYVPLLAARLGAVYPATRVTNLGVSGATAADVVREQLPRAVALNPQLVTLSIGPNDITRGRGASAYERDLATIFDTLARETGAVVVVNLIPELAQTPAIGAAEKPTITARTSTFNEGLRRQAARHGVVIVAAHDPGQPAELGYGPWVSADGYHPSDSGYARWADLLWRGIESRIPAAGP